MPRLPFRGPGDFQAEYLPEYRAESNLARTLLNSPEAARRYNALAMYIRHGSRLDPRLRELAITQVGYVARSPYEYAHHVELALGVGITREDIRAMAAETAGRPTRLSELDRAVLAAAREMAGELAVRDATFAVLRRHLDDERLIELLVAIAMYCGVVRLLETLELEVEPRVQPLLAEFPLP